MRTTGMFAALCLMACGASSQQTTASTGNGSGLICHEEKPTGTSIAREVCRTPEQGEDDRNGARSMLTARPMPKGTSH
jgi:hypothetical protein